MHPNVTRVVEAARRAGLELSLRNYPEGTHTADDAARAIGCEVAQIVKSLVFADEAGPIIALVSGANRVDTGRVAQELGSGEVRRASAREAREVTGFAIGGVPPFGHASPVRVVIDRDLLEHEVVWAAAGLSEVVFPIAPDELVRATQGTVIDLAERTAA